MKGTEQRSLDATPRRLGRGAAACVAFAALCLPPPLLAQSRSCVLTPSKSDPSEQILRCGDDLIIHAPKGTVFEPAAPQEPPAEIRLDSGPLLIEFHPTPQHPRFQILTPHAVAAVRGTKWAMEVSAERSSTLVVAGAVTVGRPGSDQTVVLGPGEGADVSPGTDPVTAKQWSKERVRALLARFSE